MSDDARNKRIWIPGLAAVVNVEYGKDATAEEMRRQRAEIKQQAADVERLQTELDNLDANAIIGRYYMRRGRNKKLTFRQHLKDVETPLSEGYMRKVKVAYDKRHRRSKPGS